MRILWAGWWKRRNSGGKKGVYAEIGRWKDICRISCDPANTDFMFRLLCLNTKHGQYLLNWKESRRHLTSIKWCASTHAGSSTSGWISVSHPSPPGGGNTPTLVGKCQKKNNSLNNTNQGVTRVSCLLQLCIYSLQNQITLVWIFRNCWLKKRTAMWSGGHFDPRLGLYHLSNWT